MTYVFLAFVAIVIILVFLLIEIRKYIWFYQKIKKPLNEHMKNNKAYGPHEYLRFPLSNASLQLLKYYQSFDDISLKNITFELRTKYETSKGNKHLTSYLTVGMLPLFSLLLASFSLFSDIVPSSNKLDILALTICIIITIVAVVFIDFTADIFLYTPMRDHLLIIDEARSHPRSH